MILSYFGTKTAAYLPQFSTISNPYLPQQQQQQMKAAPPPLSLTSLSTNSTAVGGKMYPYMTAPPPSPFSGSSICSSLEDDLQASGQESIHGSTDRLHLSSEPTQEPPSSSAAAIRSISSAPTGSSAHSLSVSYSSSSYGDPSSTHHRNDPYHPQTNNRRPSAPTPTPASSRAVSASPSSTADGIEDLREDFYP